MQGVHAGRVGVQVRRAAVRCRVPGCHRCPHEHLAPTFLSPPGRECRTPAVVSREHERERFGTHSPGPMTAAPVDSVGRQLSSTRKTQPR